MDNLSVAEDPLYFRSIWKKHDFRIFKESKLFLREDIKCLGDKCDRGIKEYHKNSLIPKKKPKKSFLTIEDIQGRIK